MKTLEKKLQVKVPAALWRQIKSLAIQYDSTAKEVVRCGLAEYVDRHLDPSGKVGK